MAVLPSSGAFLAHIAGLLQRGLAAGGSILCYHALTTPELPAESEVHLPADFLRSTLELAGVVGRIVPLRELLDRQLAGRSTHGLIAVTFDDAYASLGELAGYIEREGMPVTVFAVTGAASRGARYWWDRVDDLFPRVTVERWRRFEDDCGLPDEYRSAQPRDYGPLRPLRQWMLARHLGRWPESLEPLLGRLEAETGLTTRQRSMTFAELERFAALPSVDIGVHTASHPVLPLLEDAELVREVGGCFRELSERFPGGQPILAAPFGLFDARSVRLAREAGMLATLTLVPRTLAGQSCERGFPRFCMLRTDRRWKLWLRLTGVLELARDLRGSRQPPFPELPSPST